MLAKSMLKSDFNMSAVISDDSQMLSWKGHENKILGYPVDCNQHSNVTYTDATASSNRQTSNKNPAATVGV